MVFKIKIYWRVIYDWLNAAGLAIPGPRGDCGDGASSAYAFILKSMVRPSSRAPYGSKFRISYWKYPIG